MQNKRLSESRIFRQPLYLVNTANLGRFVFEILEHFVHAPIHLLYSILVSLKVTDVLDGPVFEFSGVSVIVLPLTFIK